MRIRSGLIVLAIVAASLAGARSASAASYQLCLALDGESGEYFMNFLMQGNAILVAGDRGHGGQDNHGPLFGALSHAPDTPQFMELGGLSRCQWRRLRERNTENVVFRFFRTAALPKRWFSSSQAFTGALA